MTPLASSDIGRKLSAGTIRFKDTFCASRKSGIGGGGIGGGGIGGGGWVHRSA